MFVFILAQDILTLLPLKSVHEQLLLTVCELVTIKKKKADKHDGQNISLNF